MQTGHKNLFKPTPEQAKKLSQWLGSFANVWNSKINENEYYYSFGSKFVPVTQWRGSKENKEPEFAYIDQSYSQFKNKELSPWLFEVPSQILRNSATRWYETQWNFMKGKCGAPQKKRNHDGRSMLLTNELFSVEKYGNKLKIFVGTKKFNVGELDIRWKNGVRIKGVPNSLTIRRDTKNRWYVSFSVDEGSGQTLEQKDMQKNWLTHLKTLPREEISSMTTGLDRGIKIPVASSYTNYEFSEAQKNNLLLNETRRKFWQRKLARQKKGSKRREITKRKIGRTYERQTNIRVDFAHQTTHKLATSDKKVFVLEDLKTQNMSASAKGTKENPGRNVAAKSGLNKAILNVGWYRIETFLIYKALREGKIVFKINPSYTSQRCSNCGNTTQANRLTQEKFVCTSCGHAENADRNAAKSIADIAVNLILDSGTELSDKGVLRPKSDKGRSSRKAQNGSSSKESSTTRQKRSAA